MKYSVNHLLITRATGSGLRSYGFCLINGEQEVLRETRFPYCSRDKIYVSCNKQGFPEFNNISFVDFSHVL